MSEQDGARDDGFDDWLDALDNGEAFYLECAAGHGSLPPRRVCPECGTDDLVEEPLPTVGQIDTYTVTHVPTPAFADDAPYATAVVDFGPVRVTGQVLGLSVDEIEPGLTVEARVTKAETTGDRLIGFTPR